MWQWLNPVNLIKIFSLVKSIIDLVNGAIGWGTAWWREYQRNKELNKMKQAEDQLGQASETADDEQRLKEKADAACKLEQGLDPDRKC